MERDPRYPHNAAILQSVCFIRASHYDRKWQVRQLASGCPIYSGFPHFSEMKERNQGLPVLNDSRDCRACGWYNRETSTTSFAHRADFSRVPARINVNGLTRFGHEVGLSCKRLNLAWSKRWGERQVQAEG
jgi:hypothetical protein